MTLPFDASTLTLSVTEDNTDDHDLLLMGANNTRLPLRWLPQQGNGQFPETSRLNEYINGPRKHQRTRSDPSNLKSDALRNVIAEAAGDMEGHSAIPNPLHPIYSGINSHLDPVLDNYSFHSDTDIQAYRDSCPFSTAMEIPPRVSSPVEPLIPTPRSTWIPLPPSPIKQEISVSHSEVLEMERTSSEIVRPEHEKLPEAHGLPQNLGLTPDDPISHKSPSFDKQWERIQQQRLDNWSLRSNIHEIRALLREKQRAKSTADDRLLQRLAMSEFGISPRKPDGIVVEKTIAELMKDCRDARGEYGPLEDSCNQLEDQLSEQEFKLTRLENHFYNQWKTPLSAREERPAFSAFQIPSPKSSSILGMSEVAVDHPLVTEFLSRSGDLDLLQERLVELEEEKESLEDERDSRQRFGMHLDFEDQVWLDSAQNLLERLVERIHITEEDVSRLRQECLSLGLIDEDGEPTDFQSPEHKDFQSEVGVNSEDQISEYVKHSLLLPRPGTKPVPPIDLSIEADDESASLRRRINQWILDRLRQSPLEVNLLARTFEKDYGEIDDRWEVLVLAVWNDDETGNINEYHVYTSSASSMTTHPYDQSYNQAYRLSSAQELRLAPSP